MTVAADSTADVGVQSISSACCLQPMPEGMTLSVSITDVMREAASSRHASLLGALLPQLLFFWCGTAVPGFTDGLSKDPFEGGQAAQQVRVDKGDHSCMQHQLVRATTACLLSSCGS